jgi:hypothetical protein
MPYSIIWDKEKAGLLVLGLVGIDEMGQFKIDVDHAIHEHRGAANWHAPLMGMIDTIINERPDKLGLKINAVKLWRMVSNTSLKESKEYIEGIVEGQIEPPVGNEFLDINENEAQYFLTQLQLHAIS